MRFILGLLAAAFSLLATPAASATYTIYYASGIGSFQSAHMTTQGYQFETGPARVWARLTLSPGWFPMCGYYTDCSLSGNDLVADYLHSTRSYGEANLLLTFAQALSGWPTTNSGFQAGSVYGKYQLTSSGDGIEFGGVLDSLHVRISETSDFYPDTSRLGLVTGIGYDSSAPEVSTWAMMLLGFSLVGGALRRRQCQKPRLNFAT